MDSYNSYNLSFLIKIIATLFFFYYLCFRLTPIAPFMDGGGWGTRHIKGVYYALLLTVRNPRKISNCLSKTKQRECPSWVCYIHASLCRTAIGVSTRQCA